LALSKNLSFLFNCGTKFLKLGLHPSIHPSMGRGEANNKIVISCKNRQSVLCAPLLSEIPAITPTTYHPSITTVPLSNGHNGPEGIQTLVVRTNEPLEQAFEQKADGMSQSINLRINVLVGDQGTPVKASIIQDQLPGELDIVLNLPTSLTPWGWII
jgi:hypothetical protein